MRLWSRKFNCCQGCGTVATPHMAKGLCRSCYMAKWQLEHQGAMEEYKRKWYQKAGGKEWSRLKREQRNYGGLRQQVLERDGLRCTLCGSSAQLLVHHRDGNGRGAAQPNNTLDNLVTLCRGCHARLHYPVAKRRNFKA